jgi:hypothetical protein
MAAQEPTDPQSVGGLVETGSAVLGNFLSFSHTRIGQLRRYGESN